MIDALTMRRRRGGVLLWLTVSFLLVSVGLILAGLFFAHNIKVREVRTGNNGEDVQVDTPLGSLHVQHGRDGRAAAIGIPVYPGAKPLHSGDSASVDLSAIFGEKDLQIVAGKWQTPDPIDKVEKYYEDKFPDMSVIQHSGEVEMHSIENRAKRVIALKTRGEGTEISLASVGEPKAN
jgi:hypothetical protein